MVGKGDILLFPGGASAEDNHQLGKKLNVPFSVEFVEVRGVPQVAGSGDLRAMVGPWGTGSVATVWHYLGQEGELVLDAAGVRAGLLSGKPLSVATVGGKSSVRVGGRRTTLILADASPEATRRLLSGARFRP
jgi:hypothetical protein